MARQLGQDKTINGIVTRVMDISEDEGIPNTSVLEIVAVDGEKEHRHRITLGGDEILVNPVTPELLSTIIEAETEALVARVSQAGQIKAAVDALAGA